MVVAAATDRLLARAVDAGDVPGVVALAADDGGVLYEGAFGARELGGKSAMTLDTVFAMASMTKAVTSVAAMHLVEQGRLTLDESLGGRLPELAAVQVLEGFDAAGAPRLRAPRRPVTLRQLLTHTAGFGYPFLNEDLLRFQQGEDATPFPWRSPMLFDPGERWEYGFSTDWVGRLVEHLSDQPLERYFREHILDPLGMVDTGFVLRPERRTRLAARHRRDPDGSMHPIEVDVPEEPAFYSGGGGLYSTGPDYLRLLRMLLRAGELGGARVLRPDTVAAMTRNQIDALVLPPSRPGLPEFFPGMAKKFGLAGLINTEETPSGRSPGSWAWGGAFNTFFWVDPTRHVAGLILTQITPFGDAAVGDLFARFERAIYEPRP